MAKISSCWVFINYLLFYSIQYEVTPQMDPKEKAKLEKQKEKDEKAKEKAKDKMIEKRKKSKEPDVVNIDPAKYIVQKADTLKVYIFIYILICVDSK